MKSDSKYPGLVVKKFNEFFLVDLVKNIHISKNKTFLCKVRKSINFKNQIIYVGDQVVINHIDLKNKSAVIENFIPRINLLKRELHY